jgi:hypothetical protein
LNPSEDLSVGDSVVDDGVEGARDAVGHHEVLLGNCCTSRSAGNGPKSGIDLLKLPFGRKF